jgi:hypothetical protein
MSSERRTAEPRRLDQVGHVPRASRRSLKYGEPRPRIDEPATLRSEVRGAREPRPFTGSAELFRRRATRADIDRGCTTTVVLLEGSPEAVHSARCPAGPDVGQQYVQLTRTPKV